MLLALGSCCVGLGSNSAVNADGFAAGYFGSLAKGEKMAWFIDSDRVKRSTKTELKHWNDVHRPGEEIPHSGIYFCTGCNKEIACNEGDPFPPQNHSQHSHSAPPIRWKLLVKTE